MRPHHRIRLLALVLVLVATSACAPRRDPNVVVVERPTPVRVQNQSWADVRVYVIAGTQRHRLGIVTGSSTQTLRIPAHLVAGGRELSFLVDPIGSRTTATSFSVFALPGETVTLTIPAQLR
jgi:hypothetical protein